MHSNTIHGITYNSFYLQKSLRFQKNIYLETQSKMRAYL